MRALKAQGMGPTRSPENCASVGRLSTGCWKANRRRLAATIRQLEREQAEQKRAWPRKKRSRHTVTAASQCPGRAIFLCAPAPLHALNVLGRVSSAFRACALAVSWRVVGVNRRRCGGGAGA